ncbi:MAG: Flp family type IVb pilin [Alcanivorax sediminis]|uniref:Flp family type IVb pilin n=1 Tax=Alcanivorax sediminis TaxID=2663008 RepID=A0A6N7LQY3_9GAMM|nr:Flp family type IVb pilin [Alcanivorax sediminis]MQX52492.1 Flp family type IVb pilin [Alcanivorax sediminis]
MKHLLARFLREEDGATIVEYAILASLISIAAIAIILLVGDEVLTLFRGAESSMKQNGM